MRLRTKVRIPYFKRLVEVDNPNSQVGALLRRNLRKMRTFLSSGLILSKSVLK